MRPNLPNRVMFEFVVEVVSTFPVIIRVLFALVSKANRYAYLQGPCWMLSVT